MSHLLDCARQAESVAIPFTDIFGVGTYVRCMKSKEKTIKEYLRDAGVHPVEIKGVTEVLFHAADVGRVFGNL